MLAMFAQDIFSRKKMGNSIALAIPILSKNKLTNELIIMKKNNYMEIYLI